MRHAVQLHVLRQYGRLVLPASPDVAIDAVVALLARALRLYDPECLGTLPAAIRDAVHNAVIRTCAQLNLHAMLACYCVVHGLRQLPAAPDRPWVAALASMLAADAGAEPDLPSLFSHLDVASLPDRPELLLAHVVCGTTPPATLVNAPGGWKASQLRMAFAGNPAVLAVFGLHAQATPAAPLPLAELAAGALVYPVDNIFADAGDVFARVRSRVPAAEIEELDYRFYLQQARPAVAWAALQRAGVACDVLAVTTVALENYLDAHVTVACLVVLRCAFGPSDEHNHALRLRDLVEVARRIHAPHELNVSPASRYAIFLVCFYFVLFCVEIHFFLPLTCRLMPDGRLVAAMVELAAAPPSARPALAGPLAVRLEKAVRRLPPRDADSRSAWRLLARFRRMAGLPPSTAFLSDCARSGNWVAFLFAAQEALVPVPDLVAATSAFANDAVRAHVLLAVMRIHGRELKGVYLPQLYPAPALVRPASPPSTLVAPAPSAPPMSPGPANPAVAPTQPQAVEDLVDVVLACVRAVPADAQRSLLAAAVQRRLPLLAALAALCGPDRVACACAWLQCRRRDSPAEADTVNTSVDGTAAGAAEALGGRDLASLLALLLDCARHRDAVPMAVGSSCTSFSMLVIPTLLSVCCFSFVIF